ncbi:MAG TPA: hypothetical protein VFJ82_22415 [Longimicrobium sp.]|nr:hypothetical protein [Longimicrobium sp.]
MIDFFVSTSIGGQHAADGQVTVAGRSGIRSGLPGDRNRGNNGPKSAFADSIRDDWRT